MAIDLNVTSGDAEVSVHVSGAYNPDILQDMANRAMALLRSADQLRTVPEEAATNGP